MALLQVVTSISYNENTDLLEIKHQGGTDNYSCTAGQTLKFIRNGNNWDLEINTGVVGNPRMTTNLLKKFTNISFTSVFEAGTWYYLLDLIGEDDIRDGYQGQGNVLYIGMISDNVSIQSQNDQITILKA